MSLTGTLAIPAECDSSHRRHTSWTAQPEQTRSARTGRRAPVLTGTLWRWDGRFDARDACVPRGSLGALATAPGGLAAGPGDGPDDGRPFLGGLQFRTTPRRFGPRVDPRHGASRRTVLHPLDDPPLRTDLPLPVRLRALHL